MPTALQSQRKARNGRRIRLRRCRIAEKPRTGAGLQPEGSEANLRRDRLLRERSPEGAAERCAIAKAHASPRSLEAPRCVGARSGKRHGEPASWLRFPVLPPDHQLQSGPGVIDRANFDVHESERETDFPNDVLGNVAGHAGRFLRPGNPENTGVIEHSAEPREFVFQNAALGREEMNESRTRSRFVDKRNSRRQRSEQLAIAGRSIERGDLRSRLDPKLLSEWRFRVTSHFPF